MEKKRTILCLMSVLLYGTSISMAASFDPCLTGTVRRGYWWEDDYMPDSLLYPYYANRCYHPIVFVEFYSAKEKRKIMEAMKMLSSEDPRQMRLHKRMAEICSTNFASSTNTIRMEMAPGLPASH